MKKFIKRRPFISGLFIGSIVAVTVVKKIRNFIDNHIIIVCIEDEDDGCKSLGKEGPNPQGQDVVNLNTDITEN